MDEDDGLALVGERLGGVLERVLAVLVLVDAHRHQRLAAAGLAVLPVAVLAHPLIVLLLRCLPFSCSDVCSKAI